MDDILKKAMRTEVSDLIDQIENIVEKYGSSNDIVYTVAVGFVEEQDEDMSNWSLHYGYNCKTMEEFQEFMYVQTNAFVMSEDEGQDEEPGHLGYSLN